MSAVKHIPAHWEAYDSRDNFVGYIYDRSKHFELEVSNEYADGLAMDFDGYTTGSIRSMHQLIESIEKMAARYSA